MHCAEGPVPLAAVEAVRAFLDKELHPWRFSVEEWMDMPRRVRHGAARLLGCHPGDVSLTSSTSAALTTVARTLPWRDGDEVLAPLGEYPSNAWPWKALEARGVTFREVPLWSGHRAGAAAWESAPPPVGVDPERALLAALGPRTRVLTASWVRFQDGLVLDLPRLAQGCAARGVELVVDGIQGVGTLPLALQGVAALATGVHKGLLSPQGAAFLYTRPDFRSRLEPAGSWLSVEEAMSPTRPATDLSRAWLATGERLETGGPGPLTMSGLEVSLDLLAGVGPDAVAAHVQACQTRLLAQVEDTPAWAREAGRLCAHLGHGRLGSILAFHHGDKGAAWLNGVVRRGVERGVYLTVREGYLRVAFHGWHTDDDVDRVAALLQEA
jgi:selenocysteine lyase/cysteine desulfurase